MTKDSLNEKNLTNLQNSTIDVEYVGDQSHTTEILVFVEYVWEHMLENDWLCDLEKQVGNYF